MKFTLTDAAKKISSILTRGGKDQQLSDRTIAENIDSLMKALVNDDTEKDTSDFISKWEEDHPVAAINEPTNKKPETTPEFEALKAEIEALKAINAQNEKNQKLSAKKTDLIAALGNKGIKDKEWLDTFLSEVNITEDMDVDAKAESYAKIYNKSNANVSPTPTPGNPTGGTVDDYAELKAASELAKQRDEQLNNI